MQTFGPLPCPPCMPRLPLQGPVQGGMAVMTQIAEEDHSGGKKTPGGWAERLMIPHVLSEWRCQ